MLYWPTGIAQECVPFTLNWCVYGLFGRAKSKGCIPSYFCPNRHISQFPLRRKSAFSEKFTLARFVIYEREIRFVSGIEETVKLVKSSGGICYGYVCDLCNREDIYRKAAQVRKEVGKVRWSRNRLSSWKSITTYYSSENTFEVFINDL